MFPLIFILIMPVRLHHLNITSYPSANLITKSLNYCVTFSNDHCVFKDLTTKRRTGLGKMHDGLYFLQPSHALLAASSPQFDIWHWRLGHTSHSRLVDLSREFSFISSSTNCECTVCPLAK